MSKSLRVTNFETRQSRVVVKAAQQLPVQRNNQLNGKTSDRRGIKALTFLAFEGIIPSQFLSNSRTVQMVFKNLIYLAAFVFAFPLILGIDLFFLERRWMYSSSFAASPTKQSSCNFLEPIKKDLIENLFDNECGDAVSLLSPYYEHLSKDLKGSWCSASRFP
jgi:hypothetical protein